MRITEGQMRMLDSLVVERLRDNREANALLVRSFENKMNPTLVKVITTDYAFDKDEEGKAAYYVVKTQAGELLLYFSLKCGELFEKLDMEKMQLASRLTKRRVIGCKKHVITMRKPCELSYDNIK